jgi:hypothetical protein
MRSFLPIGVATAAVIAIAFAAPTPAREIEVLQYGMRLDQYCVCRHHFDFTNNYHR